MSAPHPGLFRFQVAGAKWLAARETAILADEMGVGKAQPVSAKVLTPSGWRMIGDLRVGDAVFGSSGEPVQVTGVFPQGVKPVFKLTTNDGSATRCCDDHLWSVSNTSRRSRGKPWTVSTTRAMREKGLYDPAGNRRFNLPMGAPAALPARDLPLDPYLLGVILACGRFTRRYPELRSGDPELVMEASRFAPPTAMITAVGNGKYRTHYAVVKSIDTDLRQPNPVALALTNLGLYQGNFHIPDSYLHASIDQRVSLFQGLMDAACRVYHGSCVFSSSSVRLAEGVAALARSLGGVARLWAQTYHSRKERYQVAVNIPAPFNPFRLQRKAEAYTPNSKYTPSRAVAGIEPDGEESCVCIRVDAPDSLYVTDDYILTHNTSQSIAGADIAGLRKILVLCPPIARENWVREFKQWQTTERTLGAIWNSRVFPDTDVLVVGFASLTVLPIMKYLLAQRYDLLIVDEAHALKNDTAGRSRSVFGQEFDRSRGLASISKRVWELSGTLMPNHPGELWTHCRALFPSVTLDPASGRQMTYNRFTQRYCRTRHGGEKIAGANPDTAAELLRKLSPFVLRRTKAQVYPDMPSLRISQVVIRPESLPPMSREVAEAEKVVLAAYAKQTKGDTDGARKAIQAVEEMHLASLRKWTGIAKAPAIGELIAYEMKNGLRKIVLFANHREVFDILLKLIPGSVAIHGGVKPGSKPGQRQYILDGFQGKIPGYDPPCLLCHTEIASTALTLTAANEVGLAEQTWVPKDTDQAIARVWRYGQKLPVSARIFSLAGSSDEAVGATVTRKVKETNRFNAGLTASTPAVEPATPPPAAAASPDDLEAMMAELDAMLAAA